MILFNHVYVLKNYKIKHPFNENDFYDQYMLYILDKALDHVEIVEPFKYKDIAINEKYIKKIQKRRTHDKYLYLPFKGTKKIKFIKWRSLDPKVIHSSGKKYYQSDEKIPFEVIFYHNFFKKRTYKIYLNSKSVKDKDK